MGLVYVVPCQTLHAMDGERGVTLRSPMIFVFCLAFELRMALHAA